MRGLPSLKCLNLIRVGDAAREFTQRPTKLVGNGTRGHTRHRDLMPSDVDRDEDEKSPTQQAMGWSDAKAHIHRDRSGDRQRDQQAIECPMRGMSHPALQIRSVVRVCRSTENKAEAELTQRQSQDEPAAPGMNLMEEEIERVRLGGRMGQMSAPDRPRGRNLNQAEGEHGPMHCALLDAVSGARPGILLLGRRRLSQGSISIMSPACAA